MEWENPAELKVQTLISRSIISDGNLDSGMYGYEVLAEQCRKATHPIVDCILFLFFNGIIIFLHRFYYYAVGV